MIDDVPAMSFVEYLDWISSNWDLFADKSKKRKPHPQHPGQEIQVQLDKKQISQSELARRLGCTHARVNEVIKQKRSITPRFALELEKALGLPANYWLSVQAEYDLWKLRNTTKRR